MSLPDLFFSRLQARSPTFNSAEMARVAGVGGAELLAGPHERVQRGLLVRRVRLVRDRPRAAAEANLDKNG